MEVRTK